MKRVDRVAACLLLVTLRVAVAQAADVVDELRACARVSDRDQRITCYEALGARVLREEAAANAQATQADVVTPAQSTPPPATPAVAATASGSGATTEHLPDDLGGKEFRKHAKADETASAARGHIVACARSFDARWVFTFENGQVWKQTERGHESYADCDFLASITKDYFGYKMQIDGERTKMRVSRVQ